MMPRAERRTTAWERVAPRTADILIAGFGLLVLSPLMAIIVIAIRLTSPGQRCSSSAGSGSPDGCSAFISSGRCDSAAMTARSARCRL